MTDERKQESSIESFRNEKLGLRVLNTLTRTLGPKRARHAHSRQWRVYPPRRLGETRPNGHRLGLSVDA
jgi:hypothetical protein